MRKRTWWWMCGLCAGVLVACSDDDDALRCGEGTYAADGACIPLPCDGGICAQRIDGSTPLGDEWLCLRDNLPSSPSHDSAAPIAPLSYELLAIDFTTRIVPETLTGMLCLHDDPSCEDPAQVDVRPNEDGFLDFQVPHLFSGYMRLQADGVMPTVFQVNRPLTADGRSAVAWVVSTRTYESIASRSEDELLPDRGLVAFAFHDCDDMPAPGVTIARVGGNDPRPFYFSGTLPDQDLAGSRLSSNLTHDSSVVAVGGFFNVETGVVTYEARLEETADLVSRFEVDVRPNLLTLVMVYPGIY